MDASHAGEMNHYISGGTDVNYRITSGYIVLSKKLFTKEAVKPGSYLRWLLGLEGRWSKKVKNIIKDGQQVRVDYDKDDVVYLDDDFKNFVKRTKEAYGEAIEGQIFVAKLRGMRDFLEVSVEF